MHPQSDSMRVVVQYLAKTFLHTEPKRSEPVACVVWAIYLNHVEAGL